MKKLITWLYHLPTEIRDKVLTNIINQGKAKTLDEKFHTLPNALVMAFIWNQTPEGYAYWCNIVRWVKEGCPTEDTPTPIDVEAILNRPKLNIVTRFPYDEHNRDTLLINDILAASFYKEEEQGIGYRGLEISGHKASAYLYNACGEWYDGKGNMVSGYLYYSPKTSPESPKSLLQWFLEMDPDIREKAIMNAVNYPTPGTRPLGDLIGSAAGALMFGFSWKASPEGFEFWDQIYERLQSQPIQKPLNKVTEFPDENNPILRINNKAAALIYASENAGQSEGEKASGHKASIWLDNEHGYWYKASGEHIFGSLHFKPNS